MSALSMAAKLPLLDLLGARWRLETAVSCVAWDRSGALAGFGLGDGSLTMVRAEWPDGPGLRPRAGGGVELVPASKPAPPVARIPVHAGACLAIDADPDGGFLSGGDDGQLARVQPDGTIDTLAQFPGAPAAPVACGAGGWRLCAQGGSVHRLGAAPLSLTLPSPVQALAVAPDGARAAIGHGDGVTLWAGGEVARTLAAPGTYRLLAWSADSVWLAGASADHRVTVWHVPTATEHGMIVNGEPIRGLAFAAGGATLAAACGTRIVRWQVGADGAETAPAPCGIGSQEPATRLSCHPRLRLVAAGYRNGAVLICQPDSAEVVFVRGAGEGAIEALAWSPRGTGLAMGTAGGEVALVALPDELLRRQDALSP